MEIKTSAEWCRILNIIVINPKGWDSEVLDYSFHIEMIAYTEFIYRASKSEIKVIDKNKRQ